MLVIAWPSLGHGETGPAEDEANAQDRFWSQVKNVRAGPATLDFGGQVRFRYENDDGFTIKGYEPGGHDELLLERVRLDLPPGFGEGRASFSSSRTRMPSSRGSPTRISRPAARSKTRSTSGSFTPSGSTSAAALLGSVSDGSRSRTAISASSAPATGETRVASRGTRRW